MTSRGVRDPAASVRARLLNRAREQGESYERVLTRYAIERLLYRLSRTEAVDEYVLKGAMLLLRWPQQAFRPTGDLDLLGYGAPDPASITKLFTRILLVEVPEDGITFDPATLEIEPIRVRGNEDGRGQRLRLKAVLGGAIIHVQVDIGFGDHVHPAPSMADFPNLLADLPRARILMYPPETVVAEKFDAMIRLGEANTRLKDFHDLWVITRMFPLELPELLKAVEGTLRRRGTAFPTELPAGLSQRYLAIVEAGGLWRGFLKRSPPTLPPPPFVEIHEALRAFFGPVVAGLAAPEAARGRWDPGTGEWV